MLVLRVVRLEKLEESKIRLQEKLYNYVNEHLSNGQIEGVSVREFCLLLYTIALRTLSLSPLLTGPITQLRKNDCLWCVFIPTKK